ncbi:type II toxin-antitoxin system VapB family antitoxin [Dermacoccus nishinomiyaensis]
MRGDSRRLRRAGRLCARRQHRGLRQGGRRDARARRRLIAVLAVERIDARAAAPGLSRNEFLRRRLEQDVSPATPVKIGAGDGSRSSAAIEDLGDPDVMDAAWR